MTALVDDRNTPQAVGDMREGGLEANQVIFQGALVAINATGMIVKGATAVGLTGIGRAEERANSTGAAAGEVILRWRPGIFRFANSGGGDLITAADAGKLCYIVDDQTVAKTDGTGTRSRAGAVAWVDAQGVWVEFNTALTRAL